MGGRSPLGGAGSPLDEGDSRSSAGSRELPGGSRVLPCGSYASVTMPELGAPPPPHAARMTTSSAVRRMLMSITPLLEVVECGDIVHENRPRVALHRGPERRCTVGRAVVVLLPLERASPERQADTALERELRHANEPEVDLG